MATTDDELHALVAGKTIPTAFLETVADHPDQVALRWKDDDGAWQQLTYREYADRVAWAAGAYEAVGVRPGDRVVLMMRNIPEFHIADLAALFCGATPISIYNSSAPDQVEYLTNHSKAVLAVVEDRDFLDRFTKVRDKLHDLRTIVMLDGDEPPANVLALGAIDAQPVDLEAAAQRCAPDDLATVIYTSGTTGPPKGVTLTHENVLWTAESLRAALHLDSYVGKRVISYLPMAHIAERSTSHYLGALVGYEITTCPDPSLLAPYLAEVHPNFLFGVPRVWEKMHNGIVAALAADPEKSEQFASAVEAAIPIVEAVDWGRATDEQRETYAFLDEVAFAPIRALLGLDELEFGISGAAPIPADLLRWFRAIGVNLSEVYGMSESTGPMTWTPYRVKPGTVGPAIPGLTVALADDGEIICRGGNVFGGYLDDPEKTAESLDAEGWLHSGDIGTVDDDGYYRVVDRKKELIITAGGKNVSPANLEAALKSIPLVGQACAIGDDRPFVAALVVLDPEYAPVWARQHDLSFETLEDLANDPAIVAQIDADLAGAMSDFNHAEKVKKVKVLGEEWLPDSDVLTPTSKLKRRGIKARYAAEIDALYAR
jgi:long-chain acyl-CoA synthetase